MAKSLRRYTKKSENIIRGAFNSGKSVYIKQIDMNQGFHCIKINNHHELENALKTGSIIMSSLQKRALDSQYPNRFKCWKNGIKFKIHN